MSDCNRNSNKLARVLFLTLILSAVLLTPAQAGIRWFINGPDGGKVNCLVSPTPEGTLIFAGCEGGVYKSLDAGEHWKFLPNSPAPVRLLALNPQNPNKVYAATYDGVFRTQDGGLTWQRILSSVYVPNILEQRPPTGLAVDPHNPQNVYVTFPSSVSAGGISHGSFCRSDNGGQTWTEITPPGYYVGGAPWGDLNTIDSLAIDPFIPSTIYITAANNLPFRSNDSGQTFYLKNLGPGANSITSIYPEPDAQGVLYGLSSYGTLRSNDNGDHWFYSVPYGQPYSGLANCLISHQGMGWAVLAGFPWGNGVYKGYNPFTTPWTELNQGLGNGLHPLSVYALNTHVPVGAFAAVDSGVYRTDVLTPYADWRPKNQGLSNAVVTCLAVAKDAAHTVYAGTEASGIFKSSDRGSSWQAINQGIQSPSYGTLTINGLAVDAQNSLNVYAATNHGLYKSNDGGAHWTLLYWNTGDPSQPGDAYWVVADPMLPGVIYVGLELSTWNVWRTADGGVTWGNIPAVDGFPPSNLTIGPGPFPLYSLRGGLWALADLGQIWYSLGLQDQNCSLMAADPRVPTTLYVYGFSNGTYKLNKTIDFGQHWLQLNTSGLPLDPQTRQPATALAVDPANSDVYLALPNGDWQPHPDGTFTMRSGGLWKSSDGGATWTDQGLPQLRSVNAIVLDPASASIYCGLQNAGVAASNPMYRTSSVASFLSLLLGD